MNPIPKRIAVVAPNWIGDHVMAIPAYRYLRETYPNAYICLYLSPALRSLEIPEVNEVVEISSERLRKFSGLRQIAREIRERQFDLAIALPATLRIAFLLFWAGVPKRVGFRRDGNRVFFSASLPWKDRAAGKHKSQLYLDLIRWVTGSDRPLFIAELTPRSALENAIVIAPGASIELRVWPYFETLIRDCLQAFPQTKIYLVGGAKELPWGKIFSDNRVINKINQTTLGDLVGVLKRARLVVANDSGVAHLSATVAQATTLVLFGPGDPAYIRPLGPRVYSLRNETLPCSPCEKPYCRSPFGYQACLKTIPATLVLEKVKELVQDVQKTNQPL